MNKLREKYLKNINGELKLELICDQDKFVNYVNKIYFDLNKDEFNKKIIGLNDFDILQIIKDDSLINKIKTCFWLEDILKIKRLDVNDIKCDDLSNIRKTFNENIEQFYYIYMNNEGKQTTIKSIKYKISCIDSLNKLCYTYK